MCSSDLAEAIIESRAVPVCCEIDDTFNMEPDDLVARITPRTRAVIVVHMLGTPARLIEIKKICDDRGLVLIEDSAWGCGGSLDGKPLGTWGAMGTYSFDFAKTMTTGEGGMVVFNDSRLAEKAKAWHDHGHENNPAVPRWEDTRSGSGFNYRMMELQGAVGLAQLRKLDDVVARQRKNAASITSAIADVSGITPRVEPKGSAGTADAVIFGVRDKVAALACRKELLARGISTKILPEATTWHFAETWTHMPELVAAHGGNLTEAFPRSRARLEAAVSLPVFVNMPEDFAGRVREALVAALG